MAWYLLGWLLISGCVREPSDTGEHEGHVPDCDTWDGDPADCTDPACIYEHTCMEYDCSDGVDNEMDGRTDCQDLDCNCSLECDCVELICDDGLNNDEDDLVDCDDPDCADDEACAD